MTDVVHQTDEKNKLNELLDKVGQDLGEEWSAPLDAPSTSDSLSVSDQRRRGNRMLDDDYEIVSLVEQDGVIGWKMGALMNTPTSDGRRGGKQWRLAGEVLTRRKFKKLQRSKVGESLVTLDNKLTPSCIKQPLRAYENGALVRAKPVKKGRILLLVHGTFSNCDNLVGNFNKSAAGKACLAKAQAHYDQILTFDHPTLAVSPSLNGLDLAHAMASSEADVDIICHSRGGLVSRWFCEQFDRRERQRRVIFVGSPLIGTSLATPSRVCDSLDLFANLGRGIAGGMDLIPFMNVASGLLRILSSLTSLSSKLAIPDILVAAIPGLAGMSRLAPWTADTHQRGSHESGATFSRNEELERLYRYGCPEKQQYFVIRGDHEPTLGKPTWNVVKIFRDVSTKAVDELADRVIFTGANDLVVDTDSMNAANNMKAEIICSFDKDPDVWHCNYFEQQKTIDAIRSTLKF